jgi:probable phosphoglycerate mutase
VNEDLSEWDYGTYEGLTTAEIQKKHPHWNLFKEGAPGGESVDAVKARADRVLQSLRKYHGNIALFSHGHFLRVLAARFLGCEVVMGQKLLLSTSSLSILGFERENPAIFLWNRVP